MCNKTFISLIQGNQKFCSIQCRQEFYKPQKVLVNKNYTNILIPNFRDEEEFAQWVKWSAPFLGIEKILKFNNLFPDMRVVILNKIINIELEYYSSNFIHHKHDPNGCDIIFSYIKPKEQFEIKGVPVLSLYSAIKKGNGFHSFEITSEFKNYRNPFINLLKYFYKDDILKTALILPGNY